MTSIFARTRLPAQETTGRCKSGSNAPRAVPKMTYYHRGRQHKSSRASRRLCLRRRLPSSAAGSFIERCCRALFLTRSAQHQLQRRRRLERFQNDASLVIAAQKATVEKSWPHCRFQPVTDAVDAGIAGQDLLIGARSFVADAPFQTVRAVKRCVVCAGRAARQQRPHSISQP